jgi:hypothetical protein
VIPMRPLSTVELLSVWEKGLGRNSLERAQIVLQAARESPGDPDPGKLPLGERDARLLTLREWTFGSEVTALSRCHKCKEELELTFQVSDLRLPTTLPPQELNFVAGDYEIKFRLPTSGDLALVSSEAGNGGSIRNALLARCVSDARHGSDPIATEALPEFVVEELSARMSEADPQAEIELSLHCDSCGEHWNEVFDVESFFWTEIQAWAVRLLQEVHQLAASYGWSEADIVAMSATRRSAYLSMISG